MQMLPLPSQAYLKSRLHYDPATGALTWVNGRRQGMYAGSFCNDRLAIKFGVGERYYASRIIWKWMTGNDPINEIDHSDGDKLNHQWINLREAIHAQNMANAKKHSTLTSSNLKGVCWNKGAWTARVALNNKRYNLGRFATEQEAHDAYVAASRVLHGSFHRAK